MTRKKIPGRSAEFAENVINTVREPLISLNQDLRVITANRSFYNFFQVKPEETVGQWIYDLGNGQWDIPKLRELLENILPQQTNFDNYEVKHAFADIGQRTMLLNARQIEPVRGKERVILLAIEDITERRQLEEQLEESETRYRRIFETASDGIVLLEKVAGQIVHGNAAVEKILGYPREKYVGKTLLEIGVPIDVGDFPAVMHELDRTGILNYENIPVKTRFGHAITTDIYLVDRAKLAQCNIRDVSERKQAKIILQEEKKFIENALNTLQDIFFVVALDGKFLRWNTAMTHVAGYCGDDFALMKFTDLFLEADQRSISEAVLQGIKEGSASFEVMLMTQDGRQIPYEFNIARLQDHQDKPIGISGVGRDITQRKQMEERLEESEARYRRIFETTSDGIILLEKVAGQIAQGNPAVERMLGYSPAEYVGKTLLDIGVPIDVRDFPAVMQGLEKTGILNYEDVSVTTRSGHVITTDIYLVDRASLAQCNIRDVTKRKRAKDALRENMERLDLALGSAGMGAWHWDIPENKRYFDDQACQLLGLNPATFTGTAEELFGVIHPDDREQVETAQARTMAQDVLYNPGFRAVWPDGSVHHMISRGKLVRNEQHQPVRINGVLWDVSERKHLEDQLRHAQKMEAVGTLAGGIAHDFNNILNVIMGYGTLVMETLTSGSQSMENMQEVLNAADKAEDLTRRLLIFSRKQTVEMKPVNLNELIFGLQKMLLRIVTENINCTLNLANRPLIVRVDGGQIEQVLMNLVANARDAVPEGGQVAIGTDQVKMDEDYVAAYGYGKPGSYALITVADTGQGMDTETQKKIFEPFFTTKGVGEGTGLGLSISYEIIKQHNGYIRVYSEPGEGTVFKIYLPLHEEAVPGESQTEGSVPVKGGNETILVAEDDTPLRNLSRIVLESFGYTVITAKDGVEAIARFMENREQVSLVLLDMIMPKKNGKEVSEAIRQVCPEVKIIFASGYTTEIVTHQELTNSGFNFIQKPFQSRDLLVKVREVLDR